MNANAEIAVKSSSRETADFVKRKIKLLSRCAVRSSALEMSRAEVEAQIFHQDGAEEESRSYKRLGHQINDFLERQSDLIEDSLKE